MDIKTESWSGTLYAFRWTDRPAKRPENLETPFDQLDEFITPSELFYIRSHFPTPELDPVAYRLSISGAVRNELN